MSLTWLRTIAVLEIIGGCIGIGLVLLQIPDALVTNYQIAINVICIIIYAFSAIAGILLWQGRISGRTTSIIVQLIQLPKFISPTLIFFFSFGVDLYFYWVAASDFTNLRVNLKLGAYSQLLTNVPNAPFGIGFSIPACIFLAKLLKYQPNPISNRE